MESLTTQLSPPLVLTFAASDPSGGSGLQADLMAIASMGCHPLSVVTALAVQDTLGMDSVLCMEADWVESQARAILEDMPVDAFKIGLLGSVDNIAAVARIVADYPDVPLVYDPTLGCGHGDELADEEMLAAIADLLLPQTTVLTPNATEASRLAASDQGDDGDGDEPSLAMCAERLLARGCRSVLITGTHDNTPQVVNTLYDRSGVLRRDAWERLPGSYHGAGCTLAAALAAALARGQALAEAAREAQEYTWQALVASFRPGMGKFIPDRFFWARHKSPAKDSGNA